MPCHACESTAGEHHSGDQEPGDLQIGIHRTHDERNLGVRVGAGGGGPGRRPTFTCVTIIATSLSTSTPLPALPSCGRSEYGA